MQWAKQKQAGFTIVELLIVVVVIAILAAITVVAYTGVTNRTYESTVRSDITNIIKKMEQFKTLSSAGSYPTNAELSQAGVTISKGSYLSDNSRNNFYYCTSADGKSYAFGIVTKTGKGIILANGLAQDRNASTTYQANTCQAIGHADGTPGTSGYIVNSGWQGWVNG